MIYDCFLFNDELELLRLRMSELGGIVDKFVICESNISMRGAIKPCHFLDHAGEFDASKIVHLVFPFKPYEDSPENNTHFQSLMRGHFDAALSAMLNDNDTVIFGDADEIPSADFVSKYSPDQGVFRLGMPFFYYYLNLLVHDHSGNRLNQWRPIIGPGSIFKCLGFHYMRWHFPAGKNAADNAGWHFSFLGGYEALVKKIASHAEGQCSDWVATAPRSLIEERIKNGQLWDGTSQYTFIPVDATFPKTIRDNLDEYVKRGYVKLP